MNWQPISGTRLNAKWSPFVLLSVCKKTHDAIWKQQVIKANQYIKKNRVFSSMSCFKPNLNYRIYSSRYWHFLRYYLFFYRHYLSNTAFLLLGFPGYPDLDEVKPHRLPVGFIICPLRTVFGQLRLMQCGCAPPIQKTPLCTDPIADPAAA